MPLDWDPRSHIYQTSQIDNSVTDQMCAEPIWIRAVLKDGWEAIGNGFKMPVYDLVMASQNESNSFCVWWVRYVKDDIKYTFLDPKRSEIMLTANMDGCTLGLGSVTNTGGMTVSHANAASKQQAQGWAGSRPMRAQQREQTKELLGSKAKLWGPNQYRNNGAESHRADSCLAFGVFSAMEEDNRHSQGRGFFKHQMLKLKHKVSSQPSRPKWRFYEHRIEDGLGTITIKKFAHRIK